jgi:hypothetical protein
MPVGAARNADTNRGIVTVSFGTLRTAFVVRRIPILSQRTPQPALQLLGAVPGHRCHLLHRRGGQGCRHPHGPGFSPKLAAPLSLCGAARLTQGCPSSKFVTTASSTCRRRSSRPIQSPFSWGAACTNRTYVGCGGNGPACGMQLERRKDARLHARRLARSHGWSRKSFTATFQRRRTSPWQPTRTRPSTCLCPPVRNGFSGQQRCGPWRWPEAARGRRQGISLRMCTALTFPSTAPATRPSRSCIAAHTTPQACAQGELRASPRDP